MKQQVQKAIAEITYRSKRFPEEPFRIISENKEEAIPVLTKAIEKAAAEGEDLDEYYQLHFYALHLLGQFQARECFPQIMELVSLPGETLDQMIGDAITSTLPDILYNTFNGDVELLKAAIKNPDIDDYARAGMLDVMCQLYLDGDLEKERWQDFIRQIVNEERNIGDYIYTGLVQAICECHFVEMLSEIRHLYESHRVEEFVIGQYENCVDQMFRYDRSRLCKSPINAADMLRGWAMFEAEEPPEKKPETKDLKKLMKKAGMKHNKQTVRTLPKVGRNDPCPCGSGKKYKKCCLNKTKLQIKQPEDLMESEEEKKRWLENYPAPAKEREEGRIYLEDFFDAESIEIDKLVYLALMHRPIPVWSREPEKVVEERKRAYLSAAFSKFLEKTEKDSIKSFRAYDEKYSIHYSCETWFCALLQLLEKNGDEELYEKVSGCFETMKCEGRSAH